MALTLCTWVGTWVYLAASSVLVGLSLQTECNKYSDARSALLSFFRANTNILLCVNMLFACLCFVGLLLASLFLGELHSYEVKNLRDLASRLVLSHVLFMSSLLRQDFREFMLWIAWFLVVGFLNSLTMLSGDRFMRITQDPVDNLKAFSCPLALLGVAQVGNVVCVYLLHQAILPSAGLSLFLVVMYDCYILEVEILKVLGKYVFEFMQIDQYISREKATSATFVVGSLCDLSRHITTLAHYAHLWSFFGFTFSMVDLFVFGGMRHVSLKLKKKVGGLWNYWKARTEIDNTFPDASPEELRDFADNCAICRDVLAEAKKLPCGHLLHSACLRQWIQYQPICPVCRANLTNPDVQNLRRHDEPASGRAQGRNEAQANASAGVLNASGEVGARAPQQVAEPVGVGRPRMESKTEADHEPSVSALQSDATGRHCSGASEGHGGFSQPPHPMPVVAVPGAAVPPEPPAVQVAE